MSTHTFILERPLRGPGVSADDAQSHRHFAAKYRLPFPLLSDPDRTDDVRLLEHELYLAATDLDTCERIVMGGPDWDDVPISRAVSASTALPMVYKPVEIKGRHLVDGGIRSTTNVDVAVEAGAKFVIVVNPLVPYVNDFQKVIPTMLGSRVRRVRDMGFPQIGYQAFKLLAYQRLHEMARQWQERYPGVDIVLIEPEPDDEMMFQTNILNYTSRVEIARHGFESVTLKLAKDYHRYKRICEKHGVGDQFRIRQRAHAAAPAEHLDAHAEAMERLSEFEPDDAGAENGEAVGQPGPLEQRLVGQPARHRAPLGVVTLARRSRGRRT